MTRHLPVILLLALTAPLCAAPSPVRQVGLIVDASGIPSPVPFARFVDVMVETLAGSRHWEPTVLTEECPLIRASGAPWPEAKGGWESATDTLRAVLVATRLSDVLVVIPVPAAVNTVNVVWVQADQAEARRLQFMTAGSGDSSYAALTNQLVARLNGGFAAAGEASLQPALPANPPPTVPTAPATVVAVAGAPTASSVSHETPATTTPKAPPGGPASAATLTKPELMTALPVVQPVRPQAPVTQPAAEPLKPEAPMTVATAAAPTETPAAPVKAATAGPLTAPPNALPTVTAPVAPPGAAVLAPPAVPLPQLAATLAKPETGLVLQPAQPAATPVKTETPTAVVAPAVPPAPTAEPAAVTPAGAVTAGPTAQPAPIGVKPPGAAELTPPVTGAARPEAQPTLPEPPASRPATAGIPATTPSVAPGPVVPVAPTAQPAPPPAQPKAPAQFLAAAEKFLADGDFKKVEDMLLRAADADEPKTEVFYLYARLEAARQNGPAERTWLERTLNEDPGNLPARLRLAELLRGAGLWRKAVDEYNLVLKAKPDSVQAYLGLATVYAGQAQPRRAAEIVAEAVKHAPADASLYLRLGDLQAQRKALAEAESAYDRAARLSQGETRADALDRLGDLYAGAQRDHEGFLCYAEAAALRNTGNSALAEKRYQQIMAAADQSLRRSLQQAAEALRSYLTGYQVTREEAFAAMSDFNNRAQEVSKFAETIAPPSALKLQHAERKLAFSLSSEAALYGLLYLDQARPADLELYQTRLADTARGLQALPLPKG